jgi:microcystin degradation protein MlrC
VPELSGRILAIAGNDKGKAVRLAMAIGEQLVAMRAKTAPRSVPCDAGIGTAAACDGSPAVMGDPPAHAGGGVLTDNRRMIERDIQHAATGPICDPIAVGRCFAAGGDAIVSPRFGGAIGPAFGTSIDAMATAPRCDGWQNAGPGPLVDCAAIGVGGVLVVLIGRHTLALGLELFRNLGIEPAGRKLLVMQSAGHCMAAFRQIAASQAWHSWRGHRDSC